MKYPALPSEPPGPSNAGPKNQRSAHEPDSTSGKMSGPATRNQTDIWLGHELAGRSGAFNMPLTFECESWEPAAFRQALNRTLELFPPLRTRFFQAGDGELIQEVLEVAPTVEVRVHNVNPGVLLATLADAAWESLDPSCGVNLRVHVIKQSGRPVVVLIVMHHIALDEWSCGAFQQTLWRFYGSGLLVEQRVTRRAPEATGFVKYAIEEKAWLGSAGAGFALGSLVDQCQGFPGVTDFLAPPHQAKTQADEASAFEQELTMPVVKAALELGRSNRCTPFVVGLTALALGIAATVKQERFIVCVATACRWSEELLDLPGAVGGVTPLAIDMTLSRSAGDCLQAVNEAYLASFDYERIPASVWRSRLRDLGYSEHWTAFTYGRLDDSAWPLPSGIRELIWTGFAPARMAVAAHWYSTSSVQKLALYVDSGRVLTSDGQRLLEAWNEGFSRLVTLKETSAGKARMTDASD